MPQLRCFKCGKLYEEDVIYLCECGGPLEVIYNFKDIEFDIDTARNMPLGVWRYRDLLPTQRRVSLDEGGTPLYECSNLAKHLGLKNLYVKNEGANPTGSFKDRGMTVGVSKAMEFESEFVACASTGNTSASLAAYAARAGITAIVMIPSGKIAFGKLSQALIHGAKVLALPGNFDDALEAIRSACNEYGFYLLNSINPYRLEGQKTIAYEIIDQLVEQPPDRVILPVGNAGNISAIRKGFLEFGELDIIEDLPMMCGIQAQGARPVVDMYEQELADLVPEKHPETIATAIRIGNPVNWLKAITAIRESGGCSHGVSDEEILAAQKLLARKEGIFVEPASAASIAGLIKMVELQAVDPDETIVCITTGHGLKDADTAIENCKGDLIEVDDIKNIGSLLGV